MSLFKGKATHIAAIQFDIAQDDIDANLATASEMIEQAKNQGANLICLPASFATGLNFPSLRAMAQPIDGVIASFLSKQAKMHDVYICAGLLELDNKNIYDSAVLISSTGELAGKYRRCSLWQEERDFIADGQKSSAIETPLGRIGLLVSYDIRFPEASRHYFSQDVDIIICVASLFSKFSFPIESICRARAADNGCCFVLTSSLGSSRLAMMEYIGRSMIIDGLHEEVGENRDVDIMAIASDKETIINATIYARNQRKTRKNQPYLTDFLRMTDTKEHLT